MPPELASYTSHFTRSGPRFPRGSFRTAFARIRLLTLTALACGGAPAGTSELSQAATPDPGFAVQLGGDGYVSPLALALAHDGHAIVCGAVRGSLAGTFDAGEEDAFVTAVSPRGEVAWTVRFGGAGHDRATGVTILGDGTIAVTGTFSGKVNFGEVALTAKGSPDTFVVTLSPEGEPLRATALSSNAYVLSRAIAGDQSGGTLVAGSFAGTLEAAGARLTSGGVQDAFFVYLDPGGDPLWARRAGGTGFDQATAAAALPNRGFAFAGVFSESADFAGIEISSYHGSQDVFLGRLDPRGDFSWVRALGGKGDDSALALAADHSGLFVAGEFEREAFFGGPTLEADGGTDAFLAGFHPSGRHRWSRHIGGPGTDTAFAVATFGGSALVGGAFESVARAGGEPLEAANGDGLFAVTYGQDGEVELALSLGGPGHMALAGAALSSGSITLAGSFAGQISLGGASLEARGARDAFIVRLPRYRR